MAKELPYFKFKSADWLTGDIVFEPFDVQGLFINICALYWQRNADLTLSDIKRRYKNAPQLQELIGRFIMQDGDKLSIAFLDEQLAEQSQKEQSDRQNGAKGGRPKKPPVSETKPPVLGEETPGFSEKTQLEKIREEEEKKRQEEEKNAQFAAFSKQILSDRLFVEQTCQSWSLTEKQLSDMVGEFMLKQEGMNKVWKDYHDCKSNFFSWGKKNNRYLTYKQTGKTMVL